jgi:hypothetical protein
MPYEIKKVSDGFKVCKKIEDKTCFSKRGLPYKNALGQMRAIIISEMGMSRKTSKKSSKKTSKKSSKKTSKKSSRKGGNTVHKKSKKTNKIKIN